MTWIDVLKNPKIIAGIALLLLGLWGYSEFKAALAGQYDKGVSDTVAAYEESKNDATEEVIDDHNEDAEEIADHHEGTEVDAAEAEAEIADIPSIDLDSTDCSGPDLIRVQQAVYDSFPASMFVQ